MSGKIDLIRWNMLGQTLVKIQAGTNYRAAYNTYGSGTTFKPNVNELYPIPVKELDINKKIIQNPGY